MIISAVALITTLPFAFGAWLIFGGLKSKDHLLPRVAATAPGVEFRRRKHFIATSGTQKQLRQDSSIKSKKIDLELAPLIELVAVSVSGGDSLFVALKTVSERANGLVADGLQKMVAALELGSDFETELNSLAKSLPSTQILELCNKLALSINRGTPLSAMLRQQSLSLKASNRNSLLQQAGVNETRMLIPLVFMVLPITVIFSVYPSLQLLQFNYQ